MKLTKTRLKQIIREELMNEENESTWTFVYKGLLAGFRKSKDKRYYNRRSGFLIDFSEHKDVFDMVVEIAENQERDVHQQLIFIVKDWMQKQASQ